MRGIIVAMAICLIAGQVFTQRLTEEEAIAKALAFYPSVRVAELEVRQHKMMEKTAFNPEQPELIIVTPGDKGSGIELQQVFDFPTIYGKRSRWLKDQTSLSSAKANVSSLELKRDVRMAYLDVQVAQALKIIYSWQDSLWNETSQSSKRLFDAGEIDITDLLYARTQHGNVQLTMTESEINFIQSKANLEQLTGMTVDQVAELDRKVMSDEVVTDSFYFQQIAERSADVASSEINLLQSQRLPDVIIGYVREPDIETIYPNRLQAGITIPIWQGQYKGEIEAAKIELQAIEAENQLLQIQAESLQKHYVNTIEQTGKLLDYYASVGLKDADDMITSSARLFEAGEITYPQMLRNMAGSSDIRAKYIEYLKIHNEAVIQLDFLSGR